MSTPFDSAFASSLIASDMADVEWEKFQSSVLIEVKRGDKVFTSSAVVVARNVLLTCAHSVEDFEGGRVFWDAEYRPDSKKFVKIKSVILHPAYDKRKSNYENDLAVVILRNNLPSRIRPASIAENPAEIVSGMQAHRIGFGSRQGGNIRTWTNPEVREYDPSLKVFILNDSCGHLGDSGGPLYFKGQNGYRLFALHSTKEGEAKTYTVSVADHLAWIKDNMTIKAITA